MMDVLWGEEDLRVGPSAGQILPSSCATAGSF